MQTLLIILLALVFISGAPLFTIMLAGTALGSYFSARGFTIGFDGAINKLFGTSGRDEIEVLSTIPLFIFAGYILAEAKTADRLVRFANAMLGWMPGGLAIVTILTCSLFTVFTGASGVTIIALGGVLMPALVRNGYPQRFSMGLIAGTGSVGLLFPPALPLFIYGTVYGLIQSEEEKKLGVWATERFLFAGIVPGLVLVGMLSAVAVTVAVVKKLPRQKFEMGELGRSFLRALPELFIPFGVILGLAKGFGLPEIAALTVVYVVILEIVIYRMIKLKGMWAISYEAMAMIGAIFLIILCSTALTDFIVNAEVPKKLIAWTQAHVSSKIAFLLAINVILLIVGTVMDIFSAIVVVVPLIAPISRAYGIDPYHLGVIFLLNLEVGYLHPPVGLNLFLTSVKFNRPITEVMWATIPFLLTMIVALLVITYVPALTVVPEAERVAPVMNLVEIAANGVEESKVSIAEIQLVDAVGRPLKDIENKPTIRKFADCRPKIGDPKPGDPPQKPKEELEKDLTACQQLFFDVSTCKPNPKSVDAAQAICANKAIAEWTVKQMNGDILHPERAIILIGELPLVDAAGDPLEYEAPVLDDKGAPVLLPGEPELDENMKPKLDPNGQPVLGQGEPKFETKKLVGKDGKPVVKKLASCAFHNVESEREGCRAPFIAVSNCMISFEEPTDCIEEKSKACGDAPAPETPAPANEGSGSAAGSASAASAGSGSAAGSGAAGSGSATAEAGSAAAGSGSATAEAGSAAAGSAGSAGSGSAAAGSGAPTPPQAGNPAQCRKEVFATCVREQIQSCTHDAVKEFVAEKDNLKFLFDPPAPAGAAATTKGDAASMSPASKDSGGGCSTTNGAGGLLLVGAALVGLRRRRRPRLAA
ncbi:MAG: TRAP transporter large permease [Myxococcales bacterium]|nr:TRAP transporter large permease [Myxococcales bacterium]